jgi:two-component system sensor histidine kinase DctS
MDGMVAPPARPTLRRRVLLWALLMALLVVAQSLLVALTLKYEESRAQEEAEAAAVEVAGSLRRELLRQMQELQAFSAIEPGAATWRASAEALMARRQGLARLEWRDAAARVRTAADAAPGIFTQMPRDQLAVEAELSCSLAARNDSPSFSRSYFVPQANGQGVEVMDLCLPVQSGASTAGHLVGSFVLARVLEVALPQREQGRHEFSIVEADGTRLARAGPVRGSNVFVAQHAFDIPGSTLHVRADAAAGRPSLIPNLATALVLGLSLLLFAVVFLLARDVRRRAVAERALAEALALRSAMEDSLPTGLRARDLQGNVTYANPAFCAMVGFSVEELRKASRRTGRVVAPPYWPPEYEAEYQRRQSLRLSGQARTPAEAREGYETVFMRKSGERFPVMVYEAPLVDGEGRHTGWMSAVVDLSAQRRVEELSRQQQERLQASARLATVGEMASLLSHELNQPLAAIASYATGSLNLIEAPDEHTVPMLRGALERIAEQADRAGRVIKSVHSFVRRRDSVHETLPVDLLFEGVLPLVRLQARKSGTRIEIDLPNLETGGKPPRVRCDRTMVEQVLLNFSRNGIQAMEGEATPLEQRVLTLRARQTHERWVTISVIDAGAGIPPEVAARLFTPFFTTKSEGMGLGLSLCRTVVEQHGGALDFFPGPGGRGTEFRFSLPTPRAAETAPETGDTAGSATRT